MNRLGIIVFLWSLLLTSCTNETWKDIAESSTSEKAIFKLYDLGYENESSGRAGITETRYDNVFYYVVDENGEPVKNIKSQYRPSTSEIMLEGIHPGKYSLLVLGVRGDSQKDGAKIYDLHHSSDSWLEFPSDLQKPLEAEYYYSNTPFEVIETQSEGGNSEIGTLQEKVMQKRIMGKLNFEFNYHNDYVRNAVTKKTLLLDDARFATTLSGNGVFSGQSNGQMPPLDLTDSRPYVFLPTAPGKTLAGKVKITTRNYQGYEVQQMYAFSQDSLQANHINTVKTEVVHPDDKSGVIFMTESAYAEGNYKKILQDDEKKGVYTDRQQRSFNTSRPLQVSITPKGELHVRFYSPRNLGSVLVKARIPTISQEFLDIAYFDTIPAFADFYHPLPLTEHMVMYQTESGRQIEVQPMKPSDLAGAEFKVESTDVFWKKLQDIKHGWDIYWGLYGGDPEKPNGAPTGNWMGIRPVHCRESVALFLNFTYMLDTPEHEQILRDNQDKLYGNGGKEDKVTVEKVLEQMRYPRTLCVGLVYSGHGVLGLGGGSTFGAYQESWLHHYNDYYLCNIMFHELGHVMGYNHDSAFTYGPWAQELMNHFYVDNIKNFPIDSPRYLNSKNNPTLYTVY